MMELMPRKLSEIAEAIGTEDAWAIVEAAHKRAEEMGSEVKAKRPWRVSVYVPATMAPDWIKKAIGLESAEALRVAFGGEILELTNGRMTASKVRAELARGLFYRVGLPASVIGMALGCSEEAVKKQVNKPYDPARLFSALDG